MSLCSDLALCVQNTKQEVVDVVIANGSGILLSLFLENSSHSVPFFFLSLKRWCQQRLGHKYLQPLCTCRPYHMIRCVWKILPKEVILLHVIYYIYDNLHIVSFILLRDAQIMHSCLSIYLSTTWELNRVNFDK